MILVTTVVGYYVGLSGAPDYARLVHLLVGTLLAAGGTLALNQYWERTCDARMERTRVRARCRREGSRRSRRSSSAPRSPSPGSATSEPSWARW